MEAFSLSIFPGAIASDYSSVETTKAYILSVIAEGDPRRELLTDLAIADLYSAITKDENGVDLDRSSSFFPTLVGLMLADVLVLMTWPENALNLDMGVESTVQAFIPTNLQDAISCVGVQNTQLGFQHFYQNLLDWRISHLIFKEA